LGYEYFLNLTNFLKEYNQTEENRFMLKFSMFIHLLKFSLPLLSSEYRSQLSILNEAITGATLNDRWQHCIDHVDATSTLGFAVGRMFVKKKFDKAKSTASEMIKRIRDSFTANFPTIQWMDEDTRHLAEEKIKSVTELIGFPDFIMNDAEINKK
jgi:neprilysin